MARKFISQIDEAAAGVVLTQMRERFGNPTGRQLRKSKDHYDGLVEWNYGALEISVLLTDRSHVIYKKGYPRTPVRLLQVAVRTRIGNDTLVAFAQSGKNVADLTKQFDASMAKFVKNMGKGVTRLASETNNLKFTMSNLLESERDR